MWRSVLRASRTGLVGFGVVIVAVVARAEQPPAPLDIAPAPSRFTLFVEPDTSAAATPADGARVEELTLRPPVLLDEVGDSAAPAAANRQPFDKGTWALQLYGSYYDNFSGNDVTLAYATASLGYYFADNWAVELSLSGYDLEEAGESQGVAGNLGVNLRSHLLVRDPFSLYFDGGTGIFRADSRFPEGGTNTNFTLQAGLGATYRLTESLHLVGGGRWFHISNARRRGKHRNASTDGTAVYLGVMFTW